jgi:hypothetical protein
VPALQTGCPTGVEEFGAATLYKQAAPLGLKRFGTTPYKQAAPLGLKRNLRLPPLSYSYDN